MARQHRRVSRRASAARVLLDGFTERDIEQWADRSADAQAIFDRIYFDLERQRAVHYDALCEALRGFQSSCIDVEGWARVTDYRWCLQPLSAAGSLKGIGGRFNIGSDIDRARNQEFPALYIAADVATAYREFFGGLPESKKGPLLLREFALRSKSSFATFVLTGRLENVLDLRNPIGLRPFVRILSTFKMSADTLKFARAANLRVPSLIGSTKMLLNRVLGPPRVWRAEPQLFGIPAASQILGRFIRDSGFEGVLYPSQQGGTLCIAVYPENVRSGDSHIEVAKAAPPEATCLVLNRNNPCID